MNRRRGKGLHFGVNKQGYIFSFTRIEAFRLYEATLFFSAVDRETHNGYLHSLFAYYPVTYA